MTTAIVPTPLDTPCIEWTAARFSDGYGRVGDRKVHREIMKYAGHDIAGKVVRHRCDNKPCYRFNHLEIGTTADNMADMVRRCRSNAGNDHPRARLSADAVREIRHLFASFTHSEIAARYGVSQSCIDHVSTGRSWGHVHGPAIA